MEIPMTQPINSPMLGSIEGLMMKELAEHQAEIFSIFSNAKRVLIFWALMDKEMSVNDIAESIESSIQNTSQHLRLMKSMSILKTRRDKQTIYYRIADSELGDFCRLLLREVINP
jgi:DNA-binding transcriptional ArsR family regulator